LPAPASAAPVVSRPPRWAMVWSLLISLAGLVVSAYLTLEHYTASTTLACPETGVVNCQKVTTSSQSALFGVPVALLGLLFFVAMVAITLPMAWRWRSSAVRRTRIGLTIAGVLFVLYLIYAELFILDAICLWCTAVHVLALALFAVVALGTAADRTD
jgi:uncharacterized membrane protein